MGTETGRSGERDGQIIEEVSARLFHSYIPVGTGCQAEGRASVRFSISGLTGKAGRQSGASTASFMVSLKSKLPKTVKNTHWLIFVKTMSHPFIIRGPGEAQHL